MDIIIKNNIVYIFLFTMFISKNISAAADIKVAKFSPTVNVGVTYTDNVDLTPSNTESDLVTRVGVSLGDAGSGISTKGSRLRTQLNYSLDGLSYNTDSSLNDLNQNLSSSAEAEIVKNAVFLNAFANTRAVLLDQNKNASDDRVSGSKNLTNTYTYGLGALWEKKWSSYASSTLSYDYNEVNFGGGGSDVAGGNSTGNSIDFQLINGPKFNQYFWDLNYSHNETSYEGGTPDTTNELTYVTLGYHYSRILDFRVRLGYEDYNSSIDDGFGWTVGGTWTPSPRTSLDMSWGERAFGRTAFLNFSYRAKKITWQLNYQDEITNSRGQLIDNSQSINDINANPDNNQATNINNIGVPLATYSPDLYLTRRLSGSASYPFKRSTVSVSVYYERLYYTDTNNDDYDNKGTSLSWVRRLGRKNSLSTNLSWDRLEDLGSANTQNRKELSVSFRRELSPTFSANVEYSYRKNDADLRSSEYEENRVTAYVTKSF